MIRIIGGQLKRRRIHTPPDASTTRPMPDRVRQAIFNLLRGHVEGVEVFDGFAGSGSMGLEAISRGAAHVVFVEREQQVADLIEKSASELGVLDRCEIARSDALGAGAIARCPDGVHLIFFDPPYPMVRDKAQWERVKGQFARLIAKLDETGYAIIRTPWPNVHEQPRQPKTSTLCETGSSRSLRGSGRRTARLRKARSERLDAMGHDHDALDEMASMIELDEAQLAQLRASSPSSVDAASMRETNKESLARTTEPVDMTMPGAIGPETHAYGSTAIHLYMRDPDAS